jgi:hypothetical protein
MRAGGPEPRDVLLPTCPRERIQLASDAPDRRAVSAHTVLRLAKDDSLSEQPARLPGQSQARTTVDAPDGIAGDLSQATDERCGQRTQGVSISAAQPGDHTAEPGVERGYHLRPNAARVHVPRRHHRLVQPVRRDLAALQHAGWFFCLDALDLALAQARPEIFNTDQGAQFTALEFTSRLEAAEVRISMDGRGRALDNVFVERLWRSVKYEHVYLYEYAVVPELEKGLHTYFTFYNYERPQSLAYQTPAEVHFAGVSR